MEWLKPNFSFILGSGFSRALHSAMPVTSHLGEEVSEMEAIKEAGLSSLGKYDVEALLSYCFSFYPWFSESEYHSRRSLFSNLVEKIRRIIVESESNFIVKNTPEYISNLFEFWKERKIIISTFNYDTIFEKIAMKAESDKKSYNDLYKLPMQDVFDRFSGGMFGGGPPNTKQSTLAKLHGSINWYYDGSFDDQSGQIFLGPASLDKQNLFLEIATADLQPFIIPPIMEKEVLYANKLLRLNWRRAHLSVSTATVLVIIGYSLPVTDTAARLLFSQLPRNTKVYIVNTDSNEDFKRRSARYFAPTQAQLDWTYAGIDDALERFCIIELPKLREMSFK